MIALENHVAVVTGAGQGIGRGIALGLAAKRVRLFLVGRNSTTLHEVAELARASSPLVLVHATDLVADGAMTGIVENLSKQLGGLDVLIHCAGAYSSGDLQTASVEEFDRLYRTNVRVPYLLTQSLLPMLKKRKGQIVFINSSQGLHARARVGQFAATQHALKAIADSLRDEANSDGVRVFSVYPGRTATPRMEAIYRLEGKEYKPELLLQAEDVAEVVINALMMPLTAEVTNITIRPLMKSY
ncbi:MAG: SDR family NAD(P)-dependent oxidoreductase [Nitrospira sp.]|nr:SDR family NAD(P)-dependent oxidoreductase [Nitrospira sp.]TKB94771.1 MAG: SDR family NAD(P)-dependent oxidoreductase [Nitrospira sp.]